MSDISRRDFLKYLGAGAAAFMVRPKFTQALSAVKKNLLPGGFASDVVQCYDPDATTGTTINEPVVQVMMDESIKTLTGLSDVGEAWKSVFPGITETSVIGIKINCINSSLSTHPQFVNCIVNGLTQMIVGSSGFKKNNVIIWDRTDSEMTNGGYTIYAGNDPNTPRVFGTNHSGIGYNNSLPFNVNGVTSYPSKIISTMCNYLIDAAVLKNHSQGVVTLTLKNHYGSVNNPSSLLHSNACSPSVPALNQQIRDVITPGNIQKIFIIDALFGAYSGGPGGSPNFNPKLVIMSRDPVACDYQGQNVINVERANHGLSQLNCAHITAAAQPPYNLGTTDVNLIEINDPTAIGESRSAPGGRILEVSPQPMRDNATIMISLPRSSEVELDLVNAAGRTAAEVYRGRLGRGQHRINWQARAHLNPGSYFLRLAGRQGTSVRKVTVLGT